MSINSRDIIKQLKAAGFELVRTRGDHHQFKKPGHPYLVTVPHPRKDMPTGTLRSIEKQSGLRFQ